MTARELFQAGRLQEAIQAQTAEVRNHPADQGRRLFLFELLAFAGDLDRARRQIEALSSPDVQVQAAYQDYRLLLDGEQARRRLFADGVPPQFLGDPPPHVLLRLEAVQRLRAGQSGEALGLLERAAELSPEVNAHINGRQYQGLRDGDDLFGPVLEVLVGSAYFWLPLEKVKKLSMSPPRFPRDLLFIPAQLDVGSMSGAVFLPALYPGSYEHGDEAVKLGRKTDWSADQGAPVRGLGLHLLVAGDEEIPLLEVRELLGQEEEKE
jgi:type VI secretion system protein ImpE